VNHQPRGSEPSAQVDTITRNTVFSFAASMSTAAFTAVLTLYLTRALGPSEYGTFALALGLTGLLLVPSAIGSTQSAARFVAERHGNTSEIVGVLGMTLRTRLVTAFVVALALFPLAGPISALYNTPGLVWPLRGVAISLFGQSLMGFAMTIFTALRRTSRGLRLVVSESAIEFTATVSLVLLGGGATGAAFGRAVGYICGGALGMILLGRHLGRSPLFRTGPSPVRRRTYAGYAGAMFIVQGAQVAFSAIDVLLLGAFLNPSAVAFFSAPLRLIVFLRNPALALAQGVAPRMARHPDRPLDVTALVRALRYQLILQAALVAFVIVWAEPLARLLFGAGFSESAAVLRAISPYVFLSGLGPLVVIPLNYRGEGPRRIPIAIGALALNAAIDVILIPKMGVLGAAVGTDVGFAVYLAAHVRLSHQVFGLPLKPLAATSARSLVGAGALAVVLALTGTGSLSAVEWILGLAAGAVVFLTTLVLTGELSRSDAQAMWSLPKKVLRSG
jgi:O-antigen/teichoic acid export membrane protein